MSRMAIPIDNLLSPETIEDKGPDRPSGQMMMASGSTFKLLKACNFCRKRKIKCTVLKNSSICESCKEHKRECIFDHKMVNAKETKVKKPKSVSNNRGIQHRNNQTKNVYADSFNRSITGGSKSLSTYTGTFLDQISTIDLEKYSKSDPINLQDHSVSSTDSNDIDCHPSHSQVNTNSSHYDNFHDVQNHHQPPQPPSLTPDLYHSILATDRQRLIDLYIYHVEPYTPFVAYESFKTDFDDFAKLCMHIASVTPITHNISDEILASYTKMLERYFKTHIEWDELNLSCFFLLPVRIVLPREYIRTSLLAFNRLYRSNPRLPLNLIIGALSVDGWTSLFGDTSLVTDPYILEQSGDVFRTMDIKAFNYQFVNVNLFIYKMIWLRFEHSKCYEDKKSLLLQFEFDMLLFPAKLSNNLIVVGDTLLSTPEAFMLHILHDILMIAYYKFAVKNDNGFGDMTSISAVPGLYHFISGVAISNLRVTEEIAGKWSIIADLQILTAKYLLELFQAMEFSTFSFTLQYYNRRENTNFDLQTCREVDEQVRQFLETSQQIRDRTDDFDGYVVFWVFRDIRSMSLQLYINEDKKRRNSEHSDHKLT